MSATDQMIDRTGKQLFSFNALVAAWKSDHETAKAIDFGRMERQEVERFLSNAVQQWQFVVDIHEAWVDAVMSGSVQPKLRTDKRIYKLYSACSESLKNLNSMIDRLKFYNLEFEGAETFRNCFSEMLEVMNSISEPSTPVSPIPVDASYILQSSFDTERHE